jgi:hypothetical protein
VPRDCVRPLAPESLALALEPRNGQEKFALGKQLARTYHHRLEAEAVPVRVIVAEAIATGTAVTDVAKNEVVLAHKNKRRSAKPVAAKAATVTPVGKLRSGHTGTPIPTASSVLRPPRTSILPSLCQKRLHSPRHRPPAVLQQSRLRPLQAPLRAWRRNWTTWTTRSSSTP